MDPELEELDFNKEIRNTFEDFLPEDEDYYEEEEEDDT